MISVPQVLDDAAIVRVCASRALSAGFTAATRAAAERIRGRAALRQAVLVAHANLMLGPEESERGWPALVEAVTEWVTDPDDLLRAVRTLFVIDAIRLVTEGQAARGIPPEVTRGVLERHSFGWLREADAGLDPEFSPWWWGVVASGTLYRVGRLEVHPWPWPHPFRWYRHRVDGSRLLVAGAGLAVTDDGWQTGRTTWRTTFAESDGAVSGYPVRADGSLARERVNLPLTEWQLTLAPGDPALDLHIPEGARLSMPELRASLEAAEVFMDRFHPEPRFRVFMCASWLFSPQLPAMLGPESTLVRWQRAGTPFPDDSGSDFVLKWVFGSRVIDPATAPRDTRMRRGMLDLQARGEPLRSGRWVLAREDLPTFGG